MSIYFSYLYFCIYQAKYISFVHVLYTFVFAESIIVGNIVSLNMIINNSRNTFSLESVNRRDVLNVIFNIYIPHMIYMPKIHQIV